MSKPVNYYGIGLFIVVAAIIVLVTLITLSSVNWFHRPFYAETYFNESVQGLSVGSPIKLRGVQVGEVDQITFVNKVYKIKKFSRNVAGLVYVKMQLDPSDLPVKTDLRNAVNIAVKKGLRVRPTSQGLTGGSYLELSFFAKNDAPVPHYSWEPKFAFIPSSPSQFTQITQMIGDISKTFKEANLGTLSHNISRLADSANKSINEAQIGKVSQALQKAITNLNILAWRINRSLSNNQQMINSLTQNLDQMSDTLKIMLSKNPSQILFTTPPPHTMEPAQ